MESWYFAYGSNLLREQMVMRTGAAGRSDEPPRPAHLPNYEVAFHNIDPQGPAFANLVSPGVGVLGVLYRCSAADLQVLDGYEAGYERISVAVTDLQGDVVTAIAYVMVEPSARTAGSPAAEYLARILTGGRQHGLPEAYLRRIAALACGPVLPQ